MNAIIIEHMIFTDILIDVHIYCLLVCYFILTSGPQLIHQRMWYLLSCLRENAYKDPLLLIEKSSLFGESMFHVKEYVVIAILLNIQ